MALVLKDRVKETTNTVGTGTYTLAGAVTGYQSFSIIGGGNLTYYCATDGTDWEVGTGTYNSAQLTRDTIFASTNANNPVSWGVGTKDIFVTFPADTALLSGYTTPTAAINALLPVQSGNSGKYLKTDGSNVLWDVVSGFGQLYAENAVTPTAPTATGTNSVAIGNGSEAGGTDSMALAGGYVGSGATGSVAIGENGFVQTNSTYNFVAHGITSGGNGTAIGRNSAGSEANIVSGGGGVALGGSYVSGTDAFASSIADSSSSYGALATSAVALGYRAKASGQYGLAVGGDSNVAINYATAVGGLANSALAGYSFVSGFNCETTELASWATGLDARANVFAKRTHSGGKFATAGDAQNGQFFLNRASTNATPVVLTANNSGPGAANQVVLPDNSAFAFSGIIVARRQASGGTETAAWKIEGLVRREANAASTVLVASTVTAIDNTPGWVLALSADTTNGGLKIEATGAAATNIRWVASVQTSEVTYA
jgi:hypothetical protein